MNFVWKDGSRQLETTSDDTRPPYSGKRGLVRALPWCSKLRDIICPGSILVYARMIRLPAELIVEGWPFGSWSILGGLDGRRFEAELRSRGWHFRRWKTLARWGLGSSYDCALARSLHKILSSAERSWRNALEIKNLRRWQVLGFHFVRVYAEPATAYWSREHFSNKQAA